jgi:phosphatidylserine decarboxylase
MILWILLSSLALAFLVFFPIARKCEISAKRYLIGSIVVGSLTGIVTICVGISVKQSGCLFLVQFALLVLFAGILGLYRFFRDPERTPPLIDNAILAPADGTIRFIRSLSELTDSVRAGIVSDFDSKIDLANGWIIGITMTYLDVHVNRSPVDGKVLFARHIPGKFLSLKRQKATAENSRTVFVIDHDAFRIGLTLIASRMVRKILMFVKPEESVEQGQRIGKILFGSQTDIIIPTLPDTRINVEPGEQVYAGLTVLAEYRGD